jgi:hypothetical protein
MAPFVLIVACYLLYILMANSWPAGLWCAIAVGTFIVSRRLEGPWARAAKSIAMPSALGFGVVAVCLLSFNLFLPASSVFGVASSTELFLLRLSHILPIWAKPALWQVVLVLIALAVLNRYIQSVSLVGGFVRALKLLGIGTATVAAATSFSFFTSDAVLGQMTRGAEETLTVRYLSSQERIRDTLERYLLLRTQAEILNSLPIPQRQALADIHRALLKVERRSQAAATHIATKIGTERLRREQSQSSGADNSRARPSETPPAHLLALPASPDALLRDPTAVLAAQERREATARQLTSDAEQALQDAFNAAVGSGTKQVQTLAHALLDPLFEGMSLPFAPELATFVDKVSQEYIKQVVDPVVKKWATAIGSRIPPGAPGASPIGRTNATGLVRAIVEERLEAARRLANEAGIHIPADGLLTAHTPEIGFETLVSTPSPSRLLETLLLPPSRLDVATLVAPPPTGPGLDTGSATPPAGPGLDTRPAEPSAPQGKQEVANQETHDTLREPRPPSPRIVARIQPPNALDEQAYESARSRVAEATSLLEIFGPVAPLVGIRSELPREISQVLAADQAALAPYKERYAALAQQRMERWLHQHREQLNRLEQQPLEMRGREERRIEREAVRRGARSGARR